MCIPSLQEIIMPGWTTFLRRTYTEILIPGEESMKHLMNRRVTALDKSQYPWPTTTFRPLIGLDESEPWSCVPFLDPFYHQLLCPPLIGYLQLANSLSSFFPLLSSSLKYFAAWSLGPWESTNGAQTAAKQRTNGCSSQRLVYHRHHQ